jgi:hypothetical protein
LLLCAGEDLLLLLRLLPLLLFKVPWMLDCKAPDVEIIADGDYDIDLKIFT